MVTKTKTTGMAAERQRRLNKASREYLGGRISIEVFEQVERDNLPDYKQVALSLARARRQVKMKPPRERRGKHRQPK